jgi:hypothetical protein
MLEKKYHFQVRKDDKGEKIPFSGKKGRQGRHSKTTLPERLTARHFIERIHIIEKKAKPTKDLQYIA